MNDRDVLLNFIIKMSFEKRSVTLASGARSDFYLDMRKTLMTPSGVTLVGRLMWEALNIGEPQIDFVGGMAVGAVPLVTSILAECPAGILGFFVRKQRKEYGLKRLIEGHMQPGTANIALVEDVMTTGGSTFEAMRIVQDAGGRVVRVLCLMNRNEGATELFAEHGVVLESIFDRSDLPL